MEELFEKALGLVSPWFIESINFDIENNLGHGFGTPLSKRMDKSADIISFTLFQMGMEYSPKE